MKDWEDRLAELDAGVEAWNRDYARATLRLQRERLGHFRLRKPAARDLEQIERDARKELGGAALVEVSSYLERLCAHYQELGPQERAKIRARVGAFDAVFRLLWNFVEQSPSLLRGPEDADKLRLALAAISIDDARVDVELLRRALGRLWIAAARAGIDPKPEFAAIASISNKGTGGGGAHMRGFMADFDRSQYFKAQVEPHLAPSRAI
jgi:hypothetical protein